MTQNILRKLMLIAVLLTASHSFAHDFEVDGIYYNILSEEDKTVEVTYKGNSINSYTGSIVIPETVFYNGQTFAVISIGDNSFRGSNDLITIAIPNSIRSIGSRAFQQCDNLVSITIPNSVINLGEYAFYYCSNLEIVNIGDSVKSINNETFYYCSNLKTIVLGKSITHIGNSAFYQCKGLTSIIIPNSTQIIGDYAFYKCTGLKSITISNKVTSIGIMAFAYCNDLTEVTIPNSVKKIGGSAFLFCTELRSITLGSSVSDIGNNAFQYCKKITSVTLGESVESIGDYAFESCSNLPAIVIPNSVKNIGENAFYGCNRLNSLSIGNSVESIGKEAFRSCVDLTSINIPSSVQNIGEKAFYNCLDLTVVKVEEGNLIYDSRNNCNAIIETATNKLIFGSKNTIIPESIKIIDSYAFANYWLDSIIIPNSVTHIGDYAFEGSTLFTITLGKSLISLGNYAFSGCGNINKIELLNSNAFEFEENVFDSNVYINASLIVPLSSYELYKNTLHWNKFTNILSNSNCIIYVDYNNLEGRVSINGNEENTYSVNFNSKIDFVITPNKGYEIDKVLLNDVDITANVVDGKYSLDGITEDISLIVLFKDIITLTLKCSEAGIFNKIVSYGEISKFEIVPSENWEISTVLFNGNDVTNELVDNVFTTPEITEDSELSVVFADIATSVYSLYDTKDVKVYASQQTIRIKGLQDNTPVVVYGTSGQMEYSKVATDYEMNINMGKDGVYLVKVGERTFKVML